MLHHPSFVSIIFVLALSACNDLTSGRKPQPKDIKGFPPGTELASMEACTTLGGLESYSHGEYLSTTVEGDVRKVKVIVTCRNKATITMYVPVPKD